MYNLLENFLPESYANELQAEIENNTAWTFISSAAAVDGNYDVNDKNIRDSSQLVHGVIELDNPLSPLFYLIKPIIWFAEKETGLKVKSIVRVKINCLFRDGDESKYNPPHVDVYESGSISMVYYVHDSDGDTVIFDQYSKDGHNNLTEATRITPKKGNLLILHSDQFHSSSCPIKNRRRLVVNFILKVEE